MLRSLGNYSTGLSKQFRKAAAAGSACLLDTTIDKMMCL